MNGRKPFRITTEEDVGKSELLYRGDEQYLEETTDHFSDIKTSDVYPSFEEDFNCSVYFYRADDAFVNSLYSYCDENLPRLSQQDSSGVTSRYLKWGMITAGGLLILYFVYQLLLFIIRVSYSV